MDIPKNGSEQAAISLAPLETDMTVDDFLESELEIYEYVEGKLIPIPPTPVEHGNISMNLSLSLGQHVRENQLGRIYVPYTGFKIGDCVLIPDIAFVLLPQIPDDLSNVFPHSPDLAVEIIAPMDLQYNVSEKVFAYLDAGTRLVWVIEPLSRTVTIYRSKTDIKLLTRNDTLTGEDVVENFSCQIAQLFE